MSRKKYRLKKKDGNFYNLSRREIHLDIPVTVEGLKIDDCYNVSSDELNAFLVWIKSPGVDCSPDTDAIYSAKWDEKSFDKVKGPAVENQGLIDDSILSIIVFYSESIESAKVDEFRFKVKNSSDPIDLISKIRKSSPCNKVRPEKPEEQDGDVIGGNG